MCVRVRLGAEGGKTESQADSTLSAEPDVGLNLMTLGPQPDLKPRPELKPRVGHLIDCAPSLTTSIQPCSRGSVRAIRKDKEIKQIKIKTEVKLPWILPLKLIIQYMLNKLNLNKKTERSKTIGAPGWFSH